MHWCIAMGASMAVSSNVSHTASCTEPYCALLFKSRARQLLHQAARQEKARPHVVVECNCLLPLSCIAPSLM